MFGWLSCCQFHRLRYKGVPWVWGQSIVSSHGSYLAIRNVGDGKIKSRGTGLWVTETEVGVPVDHFAQSYPQSYPQLAFA